jgi:hypothetical protein
MRTEGLLGLARFARQHVSTRLDAERGLLRSYSRGNVAELARRPRLTRIAASYTDERGGRTINTIGAGDFLGEIALLDGGPRTATAATESPCRLLSMTHERFHELLETSTSVRTAVLEAVGQRLRAMDAESVI